MAAHLWNNVDQLKKKRNTPSGKNTPIPSCRNTSIQHFETALIPDVYSSVHTSGQRFPKCTLPFKDLQIRSNGNVPICQVSGSTLDPKKKKILGNVVNDPLVGLWRGEAFSAMTMAHKQRNHAGMEICRGCKGI